MKVDVLIRNGRVIDPARNINEISTVALRSGRVVEIPEGESVEAVQTVNAKGLLVVPGLIDYHEHINYRSTDVGIPPDLATLPKGVTTVVDCGSSGPTNCMAFLDRLSQCIVKSRIYVHISPLGLATQQFYEPLTPEKWDIGKFEEVFDQGGDRIRGIKMRVSNFLLKDIGMQPYYEMLKVAERFHKGVLIHPSDPPVRQGEILASLRPGDVYCHVFQGKGHTILEDGKLVPELLEARRRGVIFDIAHGAANFNFDIAEQALALGFAPDMISTDTTKKTWNKQPVCSLPYVMSKFLYLGMPLEEVIRCVTQTPARALNMEGKIGTLAPGAYGDVTLLRLDEDDYTLRDAQGNTRQGEKLLVPIATFASGLMVYQDPVFTAMQE